MLSIRFKVFVCLMLVPGLSHATSRIGSQVIDLGEVHRIHMVVGMLTTILIPGYVTGVRLGNPAVMVYKVPDNPKNEVSLWLTGALPRPTNLQIVSNDKRYVFDIVPTTSTHQDIVKVTAAFGGPSRDSEILNIIASSRKSEGSK